MNAYFIKIFVCFVLIFFTYTCAIAQNNYSSSPPTVLYAKDKKLKCIKMVKVVKKNQAYNTYRILADKRLVERKYQGHPKLFIDIPTNLNYSYEYSTFWTGGSYYVFSNDSEFIILWVFNKGVPDIQNYSGLYEEKNDFIRKREKNQGREIKENMYYGVFVQDKYLLYYYNVEEKDVELFEKSIQSLRYKK